MDTHSGKIKMTRQRRVILDALEKSDSHPTADELYDMVRRKMPKISLATVYRNLEILSEAGVVRKLEFAGCQKRFDKTLEEHNHIRCLDCGRVEDLPAGPSEGLQEKFVHETDFEIVGYKLELIGYCPVCKRRRKNKN